MQSTVLKRSIVIAGHRTSVSLEDAFWNELKMIAGERDMKVRELVTSINKDRQHSNLSSAIRLFVLNHIQSAASEEARSLRVRANGTAELQGVAGHV